MLRVLLIAEASRIDAVRAALAVLPRGAVLVQLRDKALPARRLLDAARALVAVAREFAAPVLVNGRVDVALAAGAAGVHLPADGFSVADARALLGPDAMIGASCHSREELERAAGADYCVYGPVFATPGKGPPCGLAGLSAAARATAMPVLALGGVDATNAAACIAAGARGVACVRSVLSAPDPAAAAIALWKAASA